MDPTLWIRTPAELEALARSLAGAGSLTIDTEADSLHHYPGKLCLVQIAGARTWWIRWRFRRLARWGRCWPIRGS
jgi:hypothetical protein